MEQGSRTLNPLGEETPDHILDFSAAAHPAMELRERRKAPPPNPVCGQTPAPALAGYPHWIKSDAASQLPGNDEDWIAEEIDNLDISSSWGVNGILGPDFPEYLVTRGFSLDPTWGFEEIASAARGRTRLLLYASEDPYSLLKGFALALDESMRERWADKAVIDARAAIGFWLSVEVAELLDGAMERARRKFTPENVGHARRCLDTVIEEACRWWALPQPRTDVPANASGVVDAVGEHAGAEPQPTEQRMLFNAAVAEMKRRGLHLSGRSAHRLVKYKCRREWGKWLQGKQNRQSTPDKKFRNLLKPNNYAQLEDQLRKLIAAEHASMPSGS